MIFTITRRKATTHEGAMWLVRFGSRYLDIRCARQLPWGGHMQRRGVEARRTKDGWRGYVDVHPVHIRAQYHNQSPPPGPKRRPDEQRWHVQHPP